MTVQMTKAPSHALSSDPDTMLRIETLIARYPDLAQEEEQEVLTFLKRAPALDTALLTTVDEIRPQLDRFKEDHKRHFGLSPRDYAALFMLMLCLAAVCAWLWDAGI
jgi:hypothetical protein